MSSLYRISYYPFPKLLLPEQVLCIITFSIALSKLQHTFFRDPTYFPLSLSPLNYSHESLATPCRIRLLSSSFAFSRPTEPDLVAGPPQLIFILEVTSENVLRLLFSCCDARSYPRVAAGSSASNCIDRCSDSSRPNKIQTASFSREDPRNSSQVNLPVVLLDFVVRLHSRNRFNVTQKTEYRGTK